MEGSTVILWWSVFYLLFVVAFGLVSYFTKRKYTMRKERCKAECDAEVIDIVKVEGNSSYDSNFQEAGGCYLIADYEINGERIRQKLNVDISYKKYAKGQHIKLKYNPNKPEEMLIVGEKVEMVRARNFAIFAVLAFIMCIAGDIGIVLFIRSF